MTSVSCIFLLHLEILLETFLNAFAFLFEFLDLHIAPPTI